MVTMVPESIGEAGLRGDERRADIDRNGLGEIVQA
jgi:hypothetical protein